MRERILANRYRLVEQIGVGGMAIVYRAVDMRTGHNVAVKELKPEFNRDAEFVGRFQREAEAASKMTHHNIVNLLDVGMDGENRYLIMEYVHGKTLKEVIHEKGRLNPYVASQITIRILSALQHAHNNGIIHRDIKPQNILVHADGHIKVSDFGIARMVDNSTLTKGDNVMGSVHYFSPEQASGQEVGATSDIYSTGVVLYEMLTGRLPYDGDNHVAIAMQHLHARPAPIESIVPDVPPAIIRVCMRAMEKNPAFRYQSATEMAADLRMALEGRTEQMQPYPVDASTQGIPGLYQNPVQATGTQKRLRPDRNLGSRSKKQQLLWSLLSLAVAAAVFTGLYFGGFAIYNQVVNTVTVPDVLGLEQSMAERTLQRIGLQTETVQVNHQSVPAGTVLLQAPEESNRLHKGDTVLLTVSAGPASRRVPPITGLPQQDALAALQAGSLTMFVAERVVSSDLPVGTVVSQIPEANSLCQAGDVVQVTVSGGSAYIPNVREKTLQEARDLLESNDLVMNANLLYQETDDPALHGTVANQSPEAGTQVILETAVTLTLYRVPAMTHSAEITLELPDSETTINVRLTMMENGEETIRWQGDFAPDATRHPVMELTAAEAGSYIYKVYINDKFVYQQQVTME
ncbi:MAG: Stk1 family PASTA domain-containing Ser/Thr kinase [Clostridia bacterium]|nr:Stk1 family PASTA domain-containing Ser/Thr kinase [Clostridia bacterium]